VINIRSLETEMPNPDQIAIWTIVFKIIDFLLGLTKDILGERREKRKQKRKLKPRRRRQPSSR
jgi:hypothetical protein